MNRLKNIISYSKKHIYLSICIFFIVIGSLYIACGALVTVIPYYQAEIADKLSLVLKRPVSFTQIDFSWRGFKLYANLRHVDIGSSSDDIHIENIKKIELSLYPIKSLVKLKPVVDKLVISGGKVEYNLPANKDQTSFNLNEYISKLSDNGLLHWVKSNHIYLKNTDVVFRDVNKKYKFTVAKIDFSNKGNYSYLYTKFDPDIILNTANQPNQPVYDYNKNHYVELALKYNQNKNLSNIYLSSNSWHVISKLKIAETSKLFENVDLAHDTVSKIWLSLDNEGNIKNDIKLAINSKKIIINNNIELKNIDGIFTLKNKSNQLSNFYDSFDLQIDKLNFNFVATDFNLTGNLIKENRSAPISIASEISFGGTEITEFFNKIPKGLLGEKTDKWLKTRVQSGLLGNSKILWRGNIDNSFPYENNQGVFLLKSDLKNIDINYSDEWPAIKNLYGELVIRGTDLYIHGTKAVINYNKIENLEAHIDKLGYPAGSILDINGVIHTSGKTLYKTINTTPLKDNLGLVNQKSRFTGDLSSNLNVKIGLNKNYETKIKGRIDFKNNQLDILNTPIKIDELNGSIDFTDATAYSDNLVGKFNKKDSKIFINHDKNTHIKLQGWFDSEYVLNYYGLDEKINNINQYINGASEFGLDLYYQKRKNNKQALNIDIKSNLIGIYLNLPDYIQQGELNKSKSSVKNAKLTIEDDLNNYNKYSISLNNNNILDYTVYNKNTSVSIKTNNIDGRLMFKDDGKSINGDFNQLKIYYSEDKKLINNSSKLKPEDYFNLANLNLKIQNFYYNNTNLGSLVLNITSDEENKLFNLNNSSLTGDILDFSILGHKYKIKNDNYITEISGSYKLKQLDQFGLLLGKDISKHKLRVSVQYNLEWPGDIASFDLNNVTGNIDVLSGFGRIKGVEPGVGRLFSFLNIDSITKRLRLDFSDVFEEGFKFDYLNGKITVNKGVLLTDKLILESGAADIDFYGSVDIINEKYNLGADVTAHVTSGLPVAAAVFGTPVAGAAVFLIDKILDSPVDQLVEQSYTISGAFDDPVVKKLKFKRGPLIELSWLYNNYG